MSLHLTDLAAIEDRAERANRLRVAGSRLDLGVIASVLREDVPALVSLVRRVSAELAQVREENGRLQECLEKRVERAEEALWAVGVDELRRLGFEDVAQAIEKAVRS